MADRLEDARAWPARAVRGGPPATVADRGGAVRTCLEGRTVAAALVREAALKLCTPGLAARDMRDVILMLPAELRALAGKDVGYVRCDPASLTSQIRHWLATLPPHRARALIVDALSVHLGNAAPGSADDAASGRVDR